MSKRYFCDICGQPADEGLHGTSYRIPVGHPVREYRTHADGSGCEANYQTLAVASVHFSFEAHKTGFAGPPDLCAKCAGHLIQGLQLKIQQKEHTP